MENPALYRFFGYWQIMVCLFAFVALFSIWRHITEGEERRERDYGLLWLSLSVLVWALSGGVEVLYAHHLAGRNTVEPGVFNLRYEGARSILSILNSAFILLALPCFKHIPGLLAGVLRSGTWRLLVGVTFLFSFVFTLGMLAGLAVPKTAKWINAVDVFFAVFTIFFLTLVLWSSFAKRKLPVLAVLSVLCILLTLIAQFLKLGEDTFWQLLLSCTFKTILIMIFFALALSWVEELYRVYFPEPSEMYLELVQNRQKGKNEYRAVLTIPHRIIRRPVSFTEKPFRLLLAFARKRIDEAGSDTRRGGWLEVQPKTPIGRTYDISDYNEINRILNTILDETRGKAHWDKEDRKQLRKVLFENPNNRRYRLRIDPDNIRLPDTPA